MSVLETELKPATFEEVARGRRSVRTFDPEWRISKEEMTELLELAVRAPSSSNLQPWRFLVIDDPDLKRKLLPIAFNQQQVADASAVIAVLSDVEGWRNAEEIYNQSYEAGYMTKEMAVSFAERSAKGYSALSPDAAAAVAYTDGGLVSMQLMLAARAKGYDTVPMGGYDKAKFAEAFGIEPRYLPVMLIAIGKAAKPGHPTVRLPIEKVAYWNEMPR